MKDRIEIRPISMGQCYEPGCGRTDTHYELRTDQGEGIWCPEHGLKSLRDFAVEMRRPAMPRPD